MGSCLRHLRPSYNCRDSLENGKSMKVPAFRQESCHPNSPGKSWSRCCVHRAAGPAKETHHLADLAHRSALSSYKWVQQVSVSASLSLCLSLPPSPLCCHIFLVDVPPSIFNPTGPEQALPPESPSRVACKSCHSIAAHGIAVLSLPFPCLSGLITLKKAVFATGGLRFKSSI